MPRESGASSIHRGGSQGEDLHEISVDGYWIARFRGR